MQQAKQLAEKSRREHIAKLMKTVIENTPAYTGAQLAPAPGSAYRVKVTKSATSLERF